MINVTFGLQATETNTGNIGNSDASRCFNWISVGYYDEYIEYRKVLDRPIAPIKGENESTEDFYARRQEYLINLAEYNNYTYNTENWTKSQTVEDDKFSVLQIIHTIKKLMRYNTHQNSRIPIQ